MGQTVEVISEVPVSTEEVALKNKIRSTAGTPGRLKYPIVTLERPEDDQGNRSLKPLVDTSATGTSCIHMWSND